MTVLISVFLFFLAAVIAASVALFLVLAFDSLIFGHDLPTSRRTNKALIEIIKHYQPDALTFYDLGCAHGSLALSIKKAMPDLKIFGLDNNRVRIFFAKLKSKIFGREVDFRSQDILKADLSQTDIVYAYLWFDLMAPLEKKLQTELKVGALVVTNTSHFPTWQPVQTVVTNPHAKMPDFETLFVYLKK